MFYLSYHWQRKQKYDDYSGNYKQSSILPQLIGPVIYDSSNEGLNHTKFTVDSQYLKEHRCLYSKLMAILFCNFKVYLQQAS
jgi:hypothetical protein